MGAIASQMTSLTTVYSTVYSEADQRKHQSSASLAFVRGIHRGPVNSPHKWPVTRKMFPFDDVIIFYGNALGVAWESNTPVSMPLSIAIMTSSNGNLFRVTDPLWGESTGHWWIPLPKASDALLRYFLWSVREQSRLWWCDTPSRSLWHHYTGISYSIILIFFKNSNLIT